MADISKCTGLGCSLKDRCYRFTVEANELYQSYFETPPMLKSGECLYFWGDNNNNVLNDIIKNL